ncbi:MAG: twin-arginine translocase TatA/TatE family subunit [Spirochaetota bacterium]
MNIGPMEIGLIAVVVLLLFGARKLPELARSAGKAMTEFKKGMRDLTDPTIIDAPPPVQSEPPALEQNAVPPVQKKGAHTRNVHRRVKHAGKKHRRK